MDESGGRWLVKTRTSRPCGKGYARVMFSYGRQNEGQERQERNREKIKTILCDRKVR